MLSTSSVKAGFEPGGATGVHDTDWLSLESTRVPSCFLYAAEPLGGTILVETSPPYHGRELPKKRMYDYMTS